MIEVLIAGVMASVVAVGTAAAFVAAARMTRVRNNPTFAEASISAQQTVDRFRNQVACDAVVNGTAWYTANCLVDPALPDVWVSDDLLLPANGVTDSLLNQFPNAKRCRKIIRLPNCNAGAGVSDCIQVQTKVCWNDLTNCPCP